MEYDSYLYLYQNNIYLTYKNSFVSNFISYHWYDVLYFLEM